MNRDRLTIICLSYCVGLLFTGILDFSHLNPTGLQWGIVTVAISGVSLGLGIIVPKVWRTAPKGKFWLITALVAFLAVVYFQWRVPSPKPHDISTILKNSPTQTVLIEGKVLGESRLNSSGRLSLTFQVNTVEILTKTQPNSPEKVTGKLYITLPQIPNKKYYFGQPLTVKGVLYKPISPSTPGAFNFKTYLARQGIFAGLKGEKVIAEGQPPWGFWRIRKRIITSVGRWLNSPVDSLISSISIGRKGVDLPEEINSLFIRAGLAHILAASGFQVALLLGVIIRVTRRLSSQHSLIIGVGVLIFYVGLTGIQPSVIRAVLMGFGGLIGLVLNRQVNGLGSLLLTATLLLLFYPMWIWDLGFQLSFLSTFGLIVTAPWLEKKLDWLPPLITFIITIPIAASIWTLPLLMHTFSTVATYSIPCNIITAPLVMLISLGGMISAGVALLFPLGGSAIAWVLDYPTQMLIAIASFVVHLPGSSYAVGKLPVGMMGLIYGVLLAIWLNQWCQKHWQGISLFLVTVVVVPIILTRLSLIQITVLDTKPNLSLVVQDRGKVLVIDGGNENYQKYSLLPFLTYQGVNQVDYDIAFDHQTSTLETYLPVKHFLNSQQLSSSPRISLNEVKIEYLKVTPPILQITIGDQRWVWLTQASKPPETQLIESGNVVLWTGKGLDFQWIEMINPQVAIAVSSGVEAKTRRVLQKQGIKFYWTGRDGAIQWTPKGQFQKTMVRDDQQMIIAQ
ncbi:ComEC/Rec2-related protein [Gloeothece citriformis PCC 7424]|uniref:ComEC/Rec2-related protein n=1 Tax=Gloeothece citriformis (strain PCC 7424) TaxID=65393 RepID=B7K9R4_GLOC7|nr:ComEC/Rec2 family competence protein [Gloeothece citriformis]ACK70032.1 ComEC/Rec2-related protein [Gloeothece citriformis PCC 7424]